MSDLDTDLYGDLYGNDETDFSEQVPEEDKKDFQAFEQSTSSPTSTTISSATTTDPRLTSKADIKPPQAAVSPSGTSPAGMAPSATGSISQSYTLTTQQQGPLTPSTSASSMPATQKIPTYEQPQSGYRDSSRLSIERTIRPSEMKDEG
ncbi:hypothetical protein AX15_004079 [Amanita polypyramis BW_CC]|nr:hypothetical protein AX15_004079 [Amanita polypyramis BW_CC]